MQENITNNDNKVKFDVKKIISFLKANPLVTSLIAFVIAIFALILISIIALKEYVVSVCVLMILETMMAVLLHKVELWKHGVLVVAHIVAGFIIARVPLMMVCVVAYIAATVALHFMFIKKKNSPKAQSLGLLLFGCRGRDE